MQKFKILGKPLQGEKYMEGKKEEEEGRIMPSLLAAMSALAHTTCVRTNIQIQNIF